MIKMGGGCGFSDRREVARERDGEGGGWRRLYCRSGE